MKFYAGGEFDPGEGSWSPMMKRIRYVLLICLLALPVLFGCAVPPDPLEYRHDQPSEYFLYLPKNYDPNQMWPVFIGIHGFGGTGEDCWSLWQPYADIEGFVLICPSLADIGGGWFQEEGEEKVVTIINQVSQEYNTDTRIYLAGFSAGAHFVQGYANRYANWVKGVAVLSAGTFLEPVPATANIPYLVVVGDRDDPARVLIAQQLATARENYGYDVEHLVLSGVGHRVTNKVKEETIAHYREAMGK
jgi:predicted esterase